MMDKGDGMGADAEGVSWPEQDTDNLHFIEYSEPILTKYSLYIISRHSIYITDKCRPI